MSDTTTTRFAILGQLALRPWSAYELTRSMRRTLHWFWPRAESVIYAEAKRLVADGLARAQDAPAADGSARKRQVYTITAQGRAALAAWLADPPAVLAFYVEPLLRVHLGRLGSKRDLAEAIAWADRQMDDLRAIAREVATEFAEGRHLFQDDAHTRALLFDLLWQLAETVGAWSRRSLAEVERWGDIDADAAARRRGVAYMAKTAGVRRRASSNVGPDVDAVPRARPRRSRGVR